MLENCLNVELTAAELVRLLAQELAEDSNNVQELPVLGARRQSLTRVSIEITRTVSLSKLLLISLPKLEE